MPRFQSIQVMRGAAAMLVLFFHLAATANRFVPFAWYPRVEIAQIGVDLFFVISGFVMAHSVSDLRGRGDAASFLAKRYWRIAPLLYLLTIVTVLFQLAYRDPRNVPSIINCFTILPVLWAPTKTLYALTPAWTLGFEAAFYLLVAAGILLRPRFRFVALLVVLGALPLLPIKWISAFSPYGNTMMFEFGYGVASYMAWSHGLLTRQSSLVAAVVAAVLLIAPLGQMRSFAWGIPAAFAFVAVLPWRPGKSLAERGSLWLGDASYSLYLSHLVVFNAVAPMLIPVMPMAFACTVMAIVSIASAAWLHSRVERPLLSPAVRQKVRKCGQYMLLLPLEEVNPV